MASYTTTTRIFQFVVFSCKLGSLLYLNLTGFSHCENHLLLLVYIVYVGVYLSLKGARLGKPTNDIGKIESFREISKGCY